MREAAVGKVLAREYVGWQVMRARQLLDMMQRVAAAGDANDAFIHQHTAEVLTLVNFPAEILQTAGLPVAHQTFPPLKASGALNTPTATRTIAEWRESVEASLPNLLTKDDVDHYERLLARFVKLVPKEYANGVVDGRVVIQFEVREATQFAEQAQTLINELAPVWRSADPKVYAQYHDTLVEKVEGMREAIKKTVAVSEIQRRSDEVGSILGDKFGLTARLAGTGGHVVEETALEVRASLSSSLALALSDHWQEAESQRMEGYTAFDAEIEARVLPRSPDLATRAERSFLDGINGLEGIKALLDRRAPVEELTAGYERALANLDECVALLKVSVSPATIAYTAFSILAREGLEAVIVLAALLAGLRGAENLPVRKGVTRGAWLAVVATLITFVLSRTVIQSLSHYGERLEAVVSLFAVIILLMVTNWVFHKYYWTGWNAKLRQLTRSATSSGAVRWEGFALLGVGFLTVYREGFETTLFMQSLWLEGGGISLWLGVAAGVAFISTLGVLIFHFGMKLPYRRMLVITGLLVVSILVSFTGSAVRLFQISGWLPVHPVHGLELPNWVGLWFGLYPSWEGLLIPPLGLAYVCGAWLYTKWTARRGQVENSPISYKVAVAVR
ncbi:MAG: FTR1 family protein [Chthoniobacteraceae bacterium]